MCVVLCGFCSTLVYIDMMWLLGVVHVGSLEEFDD